MDPHIVGARVAVGLIAGTLVGLTGLGGGLVLLPLLISVLGVSPIVAVGSDAVINCITKIGAGSLYWRRGSVDWRLALNLAYGSIPGAVVGVLLLAQIRAMYGQRVNEVLKVAIAALLIVIPIAYVFAGDRSTKRRNLTNVRIRNYRLGIILIGFLAGVLVGVTSIGSGSIILMLLLVFYGYTPAILVGTDIVHAVVLAGITGWLQFRMNNVDTMLVASVLLGSIPGGLLGAHLTKYLAPGRFKLLLCCVLAVVGVRMLWASILHVN
ncbi:MAG: sulfite exporter TauE/SafE family protein [Candidatus Acidiferrum sp.]